MLTDKDVLEYVQQVQAQKGDGEERVPGVSTALGKFLTERCGSVANFMSGRVRQAQSDSALDGFARLKKIRRALAALDRGGWERSYHQRLFHEHFINAISISEIAAYILVILEKRTDCVSLLPRHGESAEFVYR